MTELPKSLPLDDLTAQWLSAWLRDHDLRPAAVTPLQVEASHRRFYRLHLSRTAGDDASAILMLSPPELEQNDAFVNLSGIFRAAGVAVPAVLTGAPGADAFLLSDLGQRHLADIYRAGEPELEATALSNAILELHKLAAVRDPDIPDYTLARFEMELDLVDEWCVQGLLQSAPLHALPDGTWRIIKELLCESLLTQPKCCIHRDYHCRNILFDVPPASITNNLAHPDVDATRAEVRIGLVDFQDSLMGPRLYDIASLLRDCYHTFSEAQVRHYLDLFLAGAPDLAATPRETLQRQFDFTALQRQLKAVGIFARLHLRDGKSSHLQHIAPLFARMVALTDQYPVLAPLAELLHNHAPLVPDAVAAAETQT